MIRHLVLHGFGPAHHRFLLSLQKRRSADIAITLITRQELHFETARLLQAVAGQVPMADGGEPIEPLLRLAGVNWLDQNVQAIRASAKVLLLDDARELRFDWLSIDLEPSQNRDAAERLLPGARANGMFLRPRETFCKLWPSVAELAAKRPLRLAIICGALAPEHPNRQEDADVDSDVTAPMPLDGDTPTASSARALPTTPIDWPQEKFAIELAFAVREAFAGSAVTLVTGGQPIAAEASPALRGRIQSALRKHRVTVLADAASAIQAAAVTLRSGAQLACDVPLLALQAAAHPLLAPSGLALGESGELDVDGGQRSRSHAYVFASNGADRADARCTLLAASLRAVIDGKQPAMFRQPPGGLSAAQWQSLRVNAHHGIVSWRNWAWPRWFVGGNG